MALPSLLFALGLVVCTSNDGEVSDIRNAMSQEEDECSTLEGADDCSAHAINAMQLRKAKLTASGDALEHGFLAELEAGSVQEVGQKISQQLQVMARHTPSKSTAMFLENLRICTSCKSFSRLGEQHDGGYLTCMDGIKGGANAPGVVAAYSLGIEQHDKWSADVSRLLNVPINQFDCTVGAAAPCPTCKFYKMCLRSNDGLGEPPGHSGQSLTFLQMLNRTGQALAQDHTLLLKIDIEGAEWPAFAAEDIALLKKFEQIIVEFHHIKNEAKHPTYLQAIQKIKASGLHIAHLHGNNYEGMYSIGGASVPNVLEVTFVLGEDNHCVTDAQISTLDEPNNPSSKELPPAHIPDLKVDAGKA